MTRHIIEIALNAAAVLASAYAAYLSQRNANRCKRGVDRLLRRCFAEKTVEEKSGK